MPVPEKTTHPSIDERRASGKEARGRTPLSSHTGWRSAADRPDPVALRPLIEPLPSFDESYALMMQRRSPSSADVVQPGSILTSGRCGPAYRH